LKERRTGADKSDQAGIAVRRDCPEQIDPIVKAFRQRPQNFTAGDQQIERGRAARASRNWSRAALTSGPSPRPVCRVA